MSATVRSNTKDNDLELNIDDDNLATWNLSGCVVKVGKCEYISYGVVQQMVPAAFAAGAAKAAPQLAQIRALLKD